jgi:hypothetical protein
VASSILKFHLLVSVLLTKTALPQALTYGLNGQESEKKFILDLREK